jgi:hypothetical protein
MLDTDTTYGITPRPSAMGDLRFAGTIAAGLVAGTLGLGALAAPLVGWKDWPSALQSEATSQPVKLASPQLPGTPRNAQGGGNGGGTPAPGGATPPSIFVAGPGAVPAGTAGGGIALALGGGNQDSTSEIGKPETFDSVERGDRASTSEATGTGYNDGTGGFTAVDEGDNDQDGLKNDYEKVNNLNPNDAADATVTAPNGISALTQFKIKSAATITDGDTNKNGEIDGEDDSDGDGVSNAAEERNGSDPTLPDTDGDGNPDGMDDRDGDGRPDGLPVVTTESACNSERWTNTVCERADS